MFGMTKRLDTSKNILQLIAEAARANPSAVAVKTPEHSITYGRLVSGAMVIANEIDSKRPNDDVILVEASRCPEFIMTILGIMLTRRAFVPVCSTWPRSRIETLKKKLGVYEEPLKMMQIVDLLRPILVTRISNFESDASKVKMTDPAYCICTSGSTGEPKCIEILHQGIPNLVANQAKIFNSDASSCFLWMLSPVFDGSFSDIFVALASGSTIAVDPITEMPAYTWRAAEDARATHIDIPPALLEILSPSELPKNVECLIVGGQQLSKKIVERYAPKCKVINVYGPTEATICTSAKVYDKTNYETPQVSIGLPFDRVDYKIAEDGELLIGGIQLASRYVGDPDLTARKFFIDARGRRWYKTGDEVDGFGEYFFIGRLDRQFKVNGKLVAPEEIEAAAAKHGMVAAVVEHGGKIKCLIENLEPAMMNQKPIAMRIFKDELPEWMVPSRVKFVEKLPRLQVGKVDYAAVRKIFDDDSREVVDLDSRELREKEEKTSPILAEVKKMMADIIHKPVSSALSFKNDLGADSIQQIMLSLKIKSRWSIQLTASDFKIDDSAAGIAAVLEKKMNGNDVISASELQSRVDAIARDIDVNLYDSKKDLVVVTGAAGFLGSQVLSMLLNKWQKVVCIVKASDDTDAKKKVIEALKSKVGMTLAKPDRVICYAGDLSKERFGLMDSSMYDMLCQKTELVYHIAGEVNDWKAAEDLAASNIEATKNVIQFCKKSQAKLVFASTLSVFVSRSDLPSPYTCYESPLEENGVIVGGYAQSKWIAEKLVLDTMHDGVRILRYGLLTEPTDRVMRFEQSTLSMFLRGLRKIHVAPNVKTELKVDFTPVDIAAAVTTRAFNSKSEILHVHGGMQTKFSDIAAKVLPSSSLLDYDSWKKHALRKLEESGYDKDIAVCIEALAREEGCKFGPFDLFQSTGMVFARSGSFEAYDQALVKLEDDAHHNYVDKLLRTNYAEADKDW